jgi:hypothetical protein
LFLERHASHLHAWVRWGGVWSQVMESEHWQHFRTFVRPVLRDVVRFIQTADQPLEQTSAKLLGDPRRAEGEQL